MKLLPEPTAAAISFGMKNSNFKGTILVYDLGGGTFDVSVMKIENNQYTVLGVSGDSQLGGRDFDDAIVDYLIEQIESESDGEKVDRKNGKAMRLLLKKAEEAKRALAATDLPEFQIQIETFNAF